MAPDFTITPESTRVHITSEQNEHGVYTILLRYLTRRHILNTERFDSSTFDFLSPLLQSQDVHTFHGQIDLQLKYYKHLYMLALLHFRDQG